MSEIPAGWYPDGGPGGSKRYWDGTAWTENVSMPPKKSRTGLFLALGGGLLGLAIIVVATVVIALVVVPRVVPAKQYSTDDLAFVERPNLPAGFTQREGIVLGEVDDPSSVLDEADPAACTDLYYSTPEFNADKYDYDYVTFADASDGADSSVTAYARAFGTEDAAKSFVEHTSKMIDDCASGYSIPFTDGDGDYVTDSVEPLDIDSDLVGAAWTEPSTDASYPDFNAADLRLGNMVVRATCIGSDTVCTMFWRSVSEQMLAIEP